MADLTISGTVHGPEQSFGAPVALEVLVPAAWGYVTAVKGSATIGGQFKLVVPPEFQPPYSRPSDAIWLTGTVELVGGGTYKAERSIEVPVSKPDSDVFTIALQVPDHLDVAGANPGPMDEAPQEHEGADDVPAMLASPYALKSLFAP